MPASLPAAASAPVSVLSVASELYPLLKTGGLADVAGALPGALAPHGVAMRTLVPGYPAVMAAVMAGVMAEVKAGVTAEATAGVTAGATAGLMATDGATVLADWPGFFGGAARVLAAHHAGLDLLVLDAPHLYARAGNPYLDASGRDWSDNAVRFAALAQAAARIGWGELPGFAPQVLHAHDWQAALVPAYLHYLGAGRRRPATVLTLHNLAFQGQFKAEVWRHLGLPEAAFAMQGLEYHGDVGFLKAGIHFADAITTVSPSYAREICTLAGGMGLDAMLRWRGNALSGIVNGIDTGVWNPATDPHLARRYSARSLAGRAANRRAVEDAFGLPPDDAPLLCMVSRLTTQKGIDLVLAALDAMVEAGARLVVLGNGDAALESALLAATQRHPTRVAARIGYDEGLSHLLQGGCDAILVPSRFEPCGLTQLYGLRYGCVPVVARVGGLADTVIDANHAAVQAGVATGLQFADISAEGLLAAVQRLLQLHRQPGAWRRLQRAGMRADVGWQQSAADYAALYRRLPLPLPEPAPETP